MAVASILSDTLRLRLMKKTRNGHPFKVMSVTIREYCPLGSLLLVLF